MDSRIAGLILLGVGLLCLAAVGGVSGDVQLDQSDTTTVSGNDNQGLETQTINSSDERPEPSSTVVGPFDEPGVYEVSVAEASDISIEIIGPGGGGGSHDSSDAGGGANGGDGGYIHGKFNVSEFDKIQITVGSGGGGGDSDSGGSGGDGFYDGASGGYQNTVLGGWHSSGGGGGGATVVEGVSGGTTEPLAAAGGGGGGGAWDPYLGPSDNTGGGGGAAGGVGGTAEGGTIGGGSNGNDAENATGPVSNNLGGDGGDSTPDAADGGEDGGTWLNDEYVVEVEENTPGGGGSGGSGGEGSGGDGASGTVTLNPQLVVESIDYPDSITPGENLTVEYTLTNTGDAAGTESFVDLRVNGTNSTFDDSDQNVTVGPGELVNGTLTFDSVGEFFDVGETIEFSVELWDYDDSASGAAAVEAGSAPELVVESLKYPALIEPTDDLAVEYTVENIGDEAGTESAVELSVGGTVEDTDEAVSVGAGETANGTLTFTGVEENYGDGETIEFAVSLADFGDSQSGETDVQEIGDGPALVLANVDADESIPPAGDLTVEYTIDNVGDEAGTESAVELLVDGAVEDTNGNVTVGAGESATGTLTYGGVEGFEPGGTVGFTVALSEFGDSQSGETDLLAEGAVNLAVEPSSPVVDPGGVQTYEVVVEGADSGVLGYQGVVVELGDPGVGTITGFDEQFEDGDNVFSGSEIRNGGETLYLEAATGASFVDPGSALTIATFDVEAIGSAGATTDLTFDGTAAQTVASFETGQPYSVDTYKSADMILDAGEGPNLVLTDVQAPAEVEPSENLTVEYTVENFGGEAGTESAVTLSVNGSEADADSNVTLGSGEATSGTLTFEGVDEYGPGETIPWTVALADFGDTESGQTQLPGEADLVIDSLSYPDLVSPDDDLTVGYTLQNVGAVEGTESAVGLVVAGATVDSDENVTVSPGETASGSLVFPGVADEFLPGDIIEFTVELADFGNTESGSTSVEETGAPEFVVDSIETNAPLVEGAELTVTVTVENTGDAVGTQMVTVQTAALGQASAELSLTAGESGQMELGLDTDIGDTGQHTLTVETGNHSMTETVELHLPSMPESDGPPTDPDVDELYEDINGDGEFGIFDVQALFNHLEHSSVQDHSWAYDFNEDGDVTILDVQTLFGGS